MNTSSTLGTAFLRALYSGAAAFASVALPFYLANKGDMGRGDAVEEAIIWGLCALFGVGTMRGGVEGLLDAARQQSGDVKPSDVQGIGEGNP